MRDDPGDPDQERDPDVVVTENGKCVHIEVNEALLCDLHDSVEYETFDPGEHVWPENAVCSNCRWLAQVIGIIKSPRDR